MSALPASTVSPPDLTGARFLRSFGVALLVALWGSVCGSFVESAVGSGPEARCGALLAALLLTGCTAALAFAEAAALGTTEALGRAVREALRSSWQGAWLGGLVGGALAAGGGARLIVVLVTVAVAGGGAGLSLGRLGRIDGRLRRVHLALSLALLGCFVVTAFWGAPGTPRLTGAATAELQASPVFGPAAGRLWQVGGAAALVLAVVVWWVCSLRAGPSRDREPGLGVGSALAALVLVAGLAGGLGAVVGAAAHWLTGQLALGGALTPTAGKWLGAVLALGLWGLGRQPPPAARAGLRERLAGAMDSFLREPKTADGPPPVLTETR
jgi:hypothetical protein